MRPTAAAAILWRIQCCDRTRLDWLHTYTYTVDNDRRCAGAMLAARRLDDVRRPLVFETIG